MQRTPTSAADLNVRRGDRDVVIAKEGEWSMYPTFHLTNEFRISGPEMLSMLICTSPVTTAWGPVYPLMKDAYEKGRSLLSPEFFIKLLKKDNSPVRVMARYEWLMDEKFRANYPWEPAQVWKDDFDGEIKRIARSEESLPKEMRRVIFADRERGWELAEDTLDDASDDLKHELESIFIDESSPILPQPIRQRATFFQEKYRRNPSLTILRDVINHDLARQECGAVTSSLNPQYLSLVDRLWQKGLRIFLPHPGWRKTNREIVEFGEALEVLKSLQPLMIQNPEHYMAWFSDERRDHREKLMRLLTDPRQIGTVRQDILERLFKLLQPEESLLRELIPDLGAKDHGTRGIALAEVAQALVQILHGGIPLSIVPVTYRALRRKLRKWELWPAHVDTMMSGTGPIFELVYGTNKPTEAQLKSIIEALSNELRLIDQGS